MNREPAAQRRQLLDTLQGLLNALPRPSGGAPLRAEDVLAYLETGRGMHTGGAAMARPAATPDGDAAVEASLRLVVEAFSALLSARGGPGGTSVRVLGFPQAGFHRPGLSTDPGLSTGADAFPSARCTVGTS